MRPLTRILVIGVDAGDKDLIARWSRDGVLPNIRDIAERSIVGTVENPPGLAAGSVWPVFHSGLKPGRQQQYDGVRYFDPKTYAFLNYDCEELEQPFFWQLMSKSGMRCAIIDPPYTPLDSTINGAMVVDWGVHTPAKGGGRMEFATHPEELKDEILDLIGPDPAGGKICDDHPLETAGDYRRLRDTHLERIRKKAALTVHMLKKGGWDYFETTFSDCHCLGHQMWHVSDPDHALYDRKLNAAVGNPLRDAYTELDRAIGVILQAIDERTFVLLYCSHGMGRQYSGTNLLDRILLLLEQGEKSSGDLNLKARLKAAWRSIPPEVRNALQPIKKHFSGALTQSTFAGNRKHRRYFEVHATNSWGGIRVNLRGRESHGIVDPSEFDAISAELIADLRAIINKETGEALVTDVIVTRREYDGMYADKLPDILVEWNRNAPIRMVASEKIGVLRHQFWIRRSGDHNPVGLFCASGSGLSAKRLNEPVDAADFAPTLLQLVGLEGGHFDGQAIPALHPANIG